MKKLMVVILLLNSIWLTKIVAADSDEEWRRVKDLRGEWLFNIGDNPNWSNPDFDDSQWTKIFAPANWEDEGFPGYDGYAWYRVKFSVKVKNNLYVHLGAIDDVDQVFINGKLIGLTGQFPPDYITGFNVNRIYPIPEEYLSTNKENVIAVRVYDAELAGGITWGKIGIYERLMSLQFIKAFDGLWKFEPGDNLQRAENDYDDSDWGEILVPMSWEAQGYDNYDGFGWYRLKFNISPDFRDKTLVIMLGKIDDIDQTFLNGELIGSTGRMRDNPQQIKVRNEWEEIRAYKINADDIFFNKMNLLAVRVFDGKMQGGIFEGPVGIVTYDEYREWARKKRNRESFFYNFFR